MMHKLVVWLKKNTKKKISKKAVIKHHPLLFESDCANSSVYLLSEIVLKKLHKLKAANPVNYIHWFIGKNN